MTTETVRINPEKYPIHFRLSELKNSIEAIEKFLQWYEEQGWELYYNIDYLINQYYEIDPVAQQKELAGMIQEQEAAGAESTGIEAEPEPPLSPPIKVHFVIRSKLSLVTIKSALDIPVDHLQIQPNGTQPGAFFMTYTPPAEVQDSDALRAKLLDIGIEILQEAPKIVAAK